VTGDVADDLALLFDALRMIDGFRAPLGAFASLGNHEYFRGIEEVRAIFDRSPVPLLVDRGVPLAVGGRRLYVAGIDDPRRMGAKEHEFYRRTIDAALQDAASDDTVVLMSHRPDAFDYAAQTGVSLTLAGHTHGGQIGLMGRSAFEPLWPDRYLWGEYALSESRLYTTAGVGHWFPFRLGCPQEAPVLVLRRG
ncbi:MAG TPA: metallophosphoesterase, partial [candidate division Zixibacteria bacterium]|nr:metallophosphoesterase [candidate division Zixibacteria bacterium]